MDVPEINRRAPDPPDRQIAAWLRAQIASGAYPPDVPLPSDNELRDLFGVSRDSARHAVAVLRDEGIVYTIPTRGTNVKRPS